MAPHILVFSDFLAWCSLASWCCLLSSFIYLKKSVLSIYQVAGMLLRTGDTNPVLASA